MRDEPDLRVALDALSLEHAVGTGLRKRTQERIARRRSRRRAALAVGSAAAVLVTALAYRAVTDHEKGDRPVVAGPVDGPMADPCEGREVIETADVDGDGRDDRIFESWVDDEAQPADPGSGRHQIGICTANGLVATNVGGSNGEAPAVIDIEPDGRDEILFGGTTISADHFNIAVVDGDRLVSVTLDGDSLQLAEGSIGMISEGGAGQPTDTAAFGCEDLIGDPRRELVQVTASFSSGQMTWQKTGYELDGAVARAVFTDEGSGEPTGDRLAFPASLTRPCAPLGSEAPTTTTTTTLEEELVPPLPVAQRELASRFTAFAASPTAARGAAVPFADTVQLGLGAELLTTLGAGEVVGAARWDLELEMRWARDGGVSALTLVGDGSDLELKSGDGPGCAGLESQRPPELEGLVRLRLQPIDGTSCLDWFSVDLYLDAGGAVVAVTVELYEP